jgi:hypothetical protein
MSGDMDDLIRTAGRGLSPPLLPRREMSYADAGELAEKLGAPLDAVLDAFDVPRVDPAKFDGGAREMPLEPEPMFGDMADVLLREGKRRLRGNGGREVDLNDLAGEIEAGR